MSQQKPSFSSQWTSQAATWENRRKVNTVFQPNTREETLALLHRCNKGLDAQPLRTLVKHPALTKMEPEVTFEGRNFIPSGYKQSPLSTWCREDNVRNWTFTLTSTRPRFLPHSGCQKRLSGSQVFSNCPMITNLPQVNLGSIMWRPRTLASTQK